jgi:hypothetical protein
MARPPITRTNPYTPRSGRLAGQTFTSERQYRNALARLKGFSSWDAERRARRPHPALAVIGLHRTQVIGEEASNV